MTIDNECFDYARDCVRLANMADNPELREQLLKMAREWMAVAMKEDNLPVQEPRRAVER